MFAFFSLSLSVAIGWQTPCCSQSPPSPKTKATDPLLQLQPCSQILELGPSRGRSTERVTLLLSKNSHHFVMNPGLVLTWGL